MRKEKSFQNPLTNKVKYGIMNTESERGKAPKPSKKNLKKIKKGLDKPPNVWYNVNVNKGEVNPLK